MQEPKDPPYEEHARLVVETEVDAYDVGLCPDLVQRPSLSRHVFRHRAAVPADDAEPEGGADPGRRAPSAPEPHDPERLAGELEPGVRPPRPPADLAIHLGHPPNAIEDESDRVLGDRAIGIAADAAYADAAPLGRRGVIPARTTCPH